MRVTQAAKGHLNDPEMILNFIELRVRIRVSDERPRRQIEINFCLSRMLNRHINHKTSCLIKKTEFK